MEFFFFSDVNECNEDLHNCHSDANCENTEGSYNCTCRPGYTGDGFNCQPEETSTTTTTTTATAAASRRRSRRRRVWGWKLDDHEWPATNILPSKDSCIVLCFFLFLIVLLDALCKAFLAIFRSPNEKKKKKKNMTFSSDSTAHRCQKCKPVFVSSAGKAPIYNVDLAVKRPAETHFRQICIFHDPQSKLVSETNWQMSFYFDFRLILKQLVQIDSMFSLKYFCRRNLSPKAFLDRKNGHKNSIRAPVRFVSLMTTLPILSDIYKYIRATRVNRPLWSTRDKIINHRYTRNQGIALEPG